MNLKTRYVLILTLVLLAGAVLMGVVRVTQAHATLSANGAPTVVSYQGNVTISGIPYTGDGYFKFAIVDAAGIATYWSNDGTSSGGGAPIAEVLLLVSDGLFSVLLGDTTVGGMTQALSVQVFSQPDRYLRVWFSTSSGGSFDQLAPDTRIAAVPYALQAQQAADADTLDGLHATELGNHYQNVVIVAKSGGDYTSVQAAIDNVTGTADEPILVWVAPGVYNEMVTMKPYVHLQGAGQDATVIRSTVSNSAWPPVAATLVLASNTSLRDLTLENSGSGDSNVALLATAGVARARVADVTVRMLGSGAGNLAIALSGSGTDITLQQVTALAENASTYNYALFNLDGAATTLRGGSFIGRGGAYTRGIYNSGSGTTLDAEGVTAVGENGSGDNYGLWNLGGAAAALRNSSFIGRDGDDAYGIFNGDSNTRLEAQSVSALGENGTTYNRGLYNLDGAVGILRGGSFIGRGGTRTRGIENFNCTLEADSVTVLGEYGSTNNVGLYNVSSSPSTLRGGSFIGRGGDDAFGIFNLSSGTHLYAQNISALGENGASSNCGLVTEGGVVTTLRGGTFTGSGGAAAYGIYNSGSSTLNAESVTTLGEFGVNNYGLYNTSSATTYITQSVLEGEINSVVGESGIVTVSNSRLVGGMAAGSVTCVLVTRGTAISTDGSTCP